MLQLQKAGITLLIQNAKSLVFQLSITILFSNSLDSHQLLNPVSYFPGIQYHCHINS